ncbi:PTS system mannose-specific IIC component [Bacillus oleivorans]|uniref:PTS system mannose-specific IIC component n=1 Tax=Bacillus oleivorans TaxID=1448271 RepID=A0A285CPN7_9BACI|nr:PTS sugar transporter subunit IIC [Bacillus oleivorans]SNX69484.1 PTS system mannose-specific IIC component [Bacillus oleivorans]
MILEATLIAVWAGICTFDLFGPQTSFWRPLISGTGVGIILGDPVQGLIIAGTLELIWLGVVGVGAYVPPDVVAGSIIGTAVGILSGEGAVAGIAIAVPVAVASQQLDILWRTGTITLVHKADKAAKEGDLRKIERLHLWGIPTLILTRAIPVFLAVFLGAKYVETLFSYVPQVIMDGLTVAGGVLPALGFAMLLSLMLGKGMWVFLIAGFVLAAYLKIPTIGIALVGIVVAVLYDRFTRHSGPSNLEPSNPGGGLE